MIRGEDLRDGGYGGIWGVGKAAKRQRVLKGADKRVLTDQL